MTDKGGVLEVELSSDLADELQTPPRLTLCFDPDLSSLADYVTFGHPLLDRMLALASRRGIASSLLCTAGLEPDFVHLALSTDPYEQEETDSPAYRRLMITVGKLAFPNSRQRVMKSRMIHQLELLFYFRVSFICDEKREWIVPVLIDPLTESVDGLIDLEQVVTFLLPTTSNVTPPKSTTAAGDSELGPVPLPRFIGQATEELSRDAYAILRLYRKACAYLETVVAGDLAIYRAEAEVRLANDLDRIDEYYRELAAEILDPLRKVFRRMASLSVRAQLARSSDTQARHAAELQDMKRTAASMESTYEDELRNLQREKERRREELVSKYQTRAEASLVNMAAVRVPRLEFSLRLQGTTRRDLVLGYDVLRDHVVDLSCEACGQPLSIVFLCRCGDVLCPECFGVCPGCHREVCCNCAATRCHICDALICDQCNFSCPWGSAMPDATAVCMKCRSDFCSTCISIATVT